VSDQTSEPDDEELSDEMYHAQMLIACLVRRLGGSVTLTAAELANEPAAMSTVGHGGDFTISVHEHDAAAADRDTSRAPTGDSDG